MYAYRTAYYYKNRQRLMEYLSKYHCIDCGEKDIIVLEFDHREGVDKKICISVAVGRGWKWESILVEIAKCDVCCANCHKKRTNRRINSYRHRAQNERLQ